MAVISVFQIVSIFVFSLFVAGLLNNLWSDTENSCEMTYMFEYPQFVRIRVPKNELFPQYGLYAYSEGRFIEKARKMKFDGIPVLFLPGNVGSYKQVRSIASVALRKALQSSKYQFHFDYFTIDYNDEKSGLFGGILEGQKQYALHCIKAILNLYNSNSRPSYVKPTSLIIIGHSMGGVIAKSLMINPQSRDSISLIIALASPLKQPVLNSDYHFNNFYSDIDQHWNMKMLNTTNVAPNVWKNKILISLGGGVRDFMVPSALTYSPHSDINVLTTAIPSVWLSTDHLCIVWCKQLVLVINRFLFNIINPATKQITEDISLIIRTGNHFFKIGENRNISHYKDTVNFIPDSNWHEDNRRQYFVSHTKGVTKTWYYMVRLVDAPYHEKVTFSVTDLEDKDWLFGCQAKYVHGQYRICMNGRHLSKHSQWVPSSSSKIKTATIDLKALRNSYPHWSHVILRVSPTFKPVTIAVDIHNEASRMMQAKLPAIYSLSRQVLIKETHKGAVTYNITLPGFDMLYQAYVLFVEPANCDETNLHYATANMHVPWARGHETYSTFSDTQKSPMRLRLLDGNPNLKNATQHVHVVLNLDPKCTYTVSITSSFYDSLGQLSRHYATSLPAYIAAIALLVLRHWAASMEPNAPSLGSSFHSALCGDYTKPYYLLLSTRMATMIFVSIPFLARIAPELKINVATSQNFLLLPLFLYIVALGLMHVLGAALWCLLIFSGQIAHKVIYRLLSAGRGGGIKLWDWAANALRKAPGAGGSLLVALATGSCGAVALVAGAGFYFFLLTKMYEDYLEDLVYKTIKKVAKKLGVKRPERKSKKKNSDSKTADADDSNQNDKINDTQNEIKIDNCEKNVDNSNENKKSDASSISAIGDCEKIGPLGNDDVTSSKDAETEDSKISEVKDNSDKNGSVASDENNVESNSNEEEVFSLDSLHFHFAMFFLWCLITLLNVPALLTWAHNYKYNKILDPDPSYIPGIIMCASAALLWQIEAPKKNILYYNILKRGIYIVAVIVLITTPMALYRLNYILSAVFAIITLHQTFSRSTEENNDSDSSDGDPRAQTSKGKRIDSSENEPENSDSFSHIEKALSDDSNELDKINLLKDKIEVTEAE